ncbi:terminase small subunit [Gluconacetobacter sacchari]|uniref:DNA packaging protein n=1 Tax=Gluconacetobacter sacchari TaxID=92759 RepID=A0A7W4IBA6_9PROT|nr:terminase small subunit [Gluconacetobacter sacchari]MBB2159714.1 DNA packaging protein [Gluconacetobacter sacchari]
MLLSEVSVDQSDLPSAPTVNKRKMASLLRISLPTLTNWLDRWPEFPVAAGGRNGVAYAFDPAAVFAFLSERKREEAEHDASRDEELMKLQLSFDALWPAADPDPAPSSRIPVKEQIDLARLRDLQMKQAERAGKLVNAEEVMDLFVGAMSRLSRDMGTFLRQLGRDQGWPDAMVRQAETRFAEMQRQAVAGALKSLEPDPADDGGAQLRLAD